MLHKLADKDNPGTPGQNHNPRKSPLQVYIRFLLVHWKYKKKFEEKDCIPMFIQYVPENFLLRGCRSYVEDLSPNSPS